jgi:hypothetical protein
VTHLYLDTEFNGFNGELISLALFDPANGRVFYQVADFPSAAIDPWVREHVIPKLDKVPIGMAAFKEKLREFLAGYTWPVIVADWPADLEHLFHALMIEGHWEVDIPIQAHLINSGKFESANPHNALADAMALAQWHIEATASPTL